MGQEIRAGLRIRCLSFGLCFVSTSKPTWAYSHVLAALLRQAACLGCKGRNGVAGVPVEIWTGTGELRASPVFS